MLPHSNITFIIIFILSFTNCHGGRLNESDFEDITQNSSNRTFGRPQYNLNTSKEKNKIAISEYFSKRKVQDEQRMENLRFLPEENEVASSIGTRSGYGIPAALKARDPVVTVTKKPTEDRQVVAGIPDNSDPCFRRYSNCIVVNAQPYERRSSMTLFDCKKHCLSSQTGVYSCRSFVYDHVNEVCDLFAHVGDQSPARLLKFQTRDYFEPTSAEQCLRVNEPEVVALASNTDERKEDNDKVAAPELATQKTTQEEFPKSKCPVGKRIGFIQTENFELHGDDEAVLEVDDVSECETACENNNINGRPLECRSFNFSSARPPTRSTCYFSHEAAVPVGMGKLTQKQETVYYEKICVEDVIRQCPIEFLRAPQMILVGFAESVSDSATFEHCFDSCVNSLQLFGFNCTSGMFYFEEQQLNCILNSENRHTQKELYAEENTDIVDYFEVSCSSRKGVERPRTEGVKIKESTPIESSLSERLILADVTETDWSECADGIQHRRKECKMKINCGLESRPCTNKEVHLEKDLPTREEVAIMKAELKEKGFKCPLGKCCKVFKTCTYGLRQNANTRKLEWCKRPCEERRRKH